MSDLPAQSKKKITYRGILELLLGIARELFISSLILYLMLFVLESVFPGFVSNNFSLNYVLYIVVGLGLVAAFSPPDSAEATSGKGSKPKIADYLITVFLALIGGVLIYYKLQIELVPRIIISTIAGVMIFAISLLLLVVEDKEVEEKEEEIKTLAEDTFLSRKTFITPIALLRLLLFRKINFPVVLLLIIFWFTVLSLPQKAGYSPRKIDISGLMTKLANISKQQVQPTPFATPTSVPHEEVNKTAPSQTLMIKILNGSANKNAASDFAKKLTDTGFSKVFFGEADNHDYKNVTIKFKPEDEGQAKLIKDLLGKEYATITGVPAATGSAEITIILGTPESGAELRF